MADCHRFSRRQFLSALASTAGASCVLGTGGAFPPDSSGAVAQASHIRASDEVQSAEPIIVINRGYELLIDAQKGTLESLRSTFGPAHDLLLPGHAALPAFNVELMDSDSKFTTVNSLQAAEITVRKDGKPTEPVISISYRRIAGLDLGASVSIRCPADETLTYWTLALENETDSWIAHVQFPVIQIPFGSPGDGNSSRLLWSFADGALAGPVTPSISAGPWGASQRNTPEIWRYNNYPGEWTSTQLMAYYNDAGGLYVACDDAAGLPKFIGPLLEENGVTLGMGHYPGTRGPGTATLPYNVVLGTFHGDWYAAAEIYRKWASQQPFCSTKLAERKDCPKWIADSPVGIAFPMRGQCDWDGPAKVNPEYTPATNALPYLEKLAASLESPLMPIVFNWERRGPWVQPDAIPPLGGKDAMQKFMVRAKANGWHPVIYGDGLCWVTWQKNTDYNGMSYFHSHGGDRAVARKWDGSFLEDVWPWRKNYVACVGTEGGREMILGMTRDMAEFGPHVIQQFDQGPGPRACYAADHGHPPVPGPWMTKAFTGLVEADAQAARSANPDTAMSCEGAPPETYLQKFHIWDARVRTCPLYSFLYHEYANGHEGFYTNRVSDEALRLSVARALVTGYMVTFTLRNNGLIEYDWDQPWNSAIPDQKAILEWTRSANHFRAGIARDFLIYGRMLRPWRVSNVSEQDFGWGEEPLVQSATWRAQDGRIGVVLANCGDLGESPRVELVGQGSKHLSLMIDGKQTTRLLNLPAVLTLDMLPRSLALAELK